MLIKFGKRYGRFLGKLTRTKAYQTFKKDSEQTSILNRIRLVQFGKPDFVV